MNQLVPARDDVNLVPFVDLDVSAQFVAIPQVCQQPRFPAVFGSHQLAAPGDDAAGCAAFVVLSGIPVRAIEIGLWTAQVPLRVGSNIGHTSRLPARARTAGAASAS